MATFQFTVETNSVVDSEECQITLSAFEERMLQPQPLYALDMLRQRLLYTMVTDHFRTRAVRVLVQTVLDTELKILLTKLVTIAPGVAESHVCLRRHYNEIDADMQLYSFLVEPALVELATLIPDSYIRMIRRYLITPYPRYRVSTLSLIVCLVVGSQMAAEAADGNGDGGGGDGGGDGDEGGGDGGGGGQDQ